MPLGVHIICNKKNNFSSITETVEEKKILESFSGISNDKWKLILQACRYSLKVFIMAWAFSVFSALMLSGSKPCRMHPPSPNTQHIFLTFLPSTALGQPRHLQLLSCLPSFLCQPTPHSHIYHHEPSCSQPFETFPLPLE